jgi:hypothetical protein
MVIFSIGVAVGLSAAATLAVLVLMWRELIIEAERNG